MIVCIQLFGRERELRHGEIAVSRSCGTVFTSSAVRMQRIVAVAGFTPRSGRFQNGELMWYPLQMSVTTGTLRNFASFPSDTGCTDKKKPNFD